ncbi:MAG: hypothetical protein WD358_03850 [Nitriliruptoraceae bacterium]
MDLQRLPFEYDDLIARAMELVPRIWARDHTVWGKDPSEIADRLGWLDSNTRTTSTESELVQAASVVRSGGVDDVVLVGMGGSSLYPAVLAEISQTLHADESDVPPRLHVLDSTDPAAVRRVEAQLDWTTTALIAASKSGTTIETTCHLDRLWAVLVDALGSAAGTRVTVITDPGSAFDERAAREGFAQVINGQPDVGGRFSALTPFGLLPAAVLGIAPGEHVAGATDTFAAARSTDPQRNHPAVLGALMAAAARAGRDKLTLLVSERVSGLGAWIEQLVAESTGKLGTGLLPVVDEEPGRARFGADRFVVTIGSPDVHLQMLDDEGVPFVSLPWDDGEDLATQLAEQVAIWEFATAVGGALLGVNPFDQPDVTEAKQATQRVLDEGIELPPLSHPQPVLDQLQPGDYLALLGFVTPGGSDELGLHQVADRLRQRYEVPVTIGVGPRYLHSTGQYHKGGPNKGVFLMVVGDDIADVEIPGRAFGFRALKRAQAAGDFDTLQARGRRVALTTLDDLTH